jgi:hypothetical protein
MKKSVALLFLLVLSFGLVNSLAAVDVTLFGPTKYVRTDGTKNIFQASFPAVAGTGTLVVTNGDSSGYNRVSSAIIKINGATILGTSSLNLSRPGYTASVALNETNSIYIELRSTVGSFLTVQVTQEVEADGAAVIGSAGGTLSVEDPSSPLKGLSVTFPPDAIAVPVVIRATATTDQLPQFSEKFEQATIASFRLEPELVNLQYPAELRIPFHDEDKDGFVDGTTLPVGSIQLYYSNSRNPGYSREDAWLDEARSLIVARPKHFSTWLSVPGRWKDGSQITYLITRLPTPIDSPDDLAFRQDVTKAFALWAAALNYKITFAEISYGIPDLVIDSVDFVEVGFRDGSENCFPALTRSIDTLTGHQKRIYFETAECYRWFAGDYDNFVQPEFGWFRLAPFLREAAHEFGHAIGLHDYSLRVPRLSDGYTFNPCNASTVAANVMIYDCEGLLPLTSLGTFDIHEAQNLYGINAALPAEFTYSLISPPEAQWTEAEGLNDKEEIVGIFTDSALIQHGYLLRNGQFESIPLLPRTINNSGAILNGSSLVLSDGVWKTASQIHSDLLWIDDINNFGAVVGRTEYGEEVVRKVGDVDQAYSLPMEGGCVWTSINDSLEAGGFYIDTQGQSHSCLYKNGQVLRFDPPGTSRSFIVALGNAFAVGTAFVGGTPTFFVTNGVASKIFPNPAGYMLTVRGVNDKGQIVGRRFSTSTSIGQVGFLGNPIW